MTIPSEVWAALASAFVVITSTLGIGWFRDLSARVRHLEELTVQQAEQIKELKFERQKLRERLQKHGLEEESDV
jgi:hypothetical protein